MREIRPSGSMSGKWNRGMVAILWHSQTKGRATVNTNSNLNHAPVLDSTRGFLRWFSAVTARTDRTMNSSRLGAGFRSALIGSTRHAHDCAWAWVTIRQAARGTWSVPATQVCRLPYFTQQQAPLGEQGQALQTQVPVSQQPQAQEQAQGPPLSQQPVLQAGAEAGVENREASKSNKAFIENLQ